MHHFCTLLLLTLISVTSICQSNSTYLVHYHFSQTLTPSEFPDSIRSKKVEIQMQFGSDTLLKRETALYSFENLLGTIEMDVIVYILANIDSSKTFFHYDEAGTKQRSNFIMSTPDTNYYKQGIWTKYSDGSTELLPLISVEVVKTHERKNILGYNCIKFISKEENDDEKIVFWASEQLPATLLPFTGLKEFKYGILEIDHRKNHWHIIAKKIEPR